MFVFVVKLREREGLRVDSGCPLSIIDIDCQLSISISLKLYTKFGCHLPPPPPRRLNSLKKWPAQAHVR